jgi:hypothetical protein
MDVHALILEHDKLKIQFENGDAHLSTDCDHNSPSTHYIWCIWWFQLENSLIVTDRFNRGNASDKHSLV